MKSSTPTKATATATAARARGGRGPTKSRAASAASCRRRSGSCWTDWSMTRRSPRRRPAGLTTRRARRAASCPRGPSWVGALRPGFRVRLCSLVSVRLCVSRRACCRAAHSACHTLCVRTLGAPAGVAAPAGEGGGWTLMALDPSRLTSMSMRGLSEEAMWARLGALGVAPPLLVHRAPGDAGQVRAAAGGARCCCSMVGRSFMLNGSLSQRFGRRAARVARRPRPLAPSQTPSHTPRSLPRAAGCLSSGPHRRRGE